MTSRNNNNNDNNNNNNIGGSWMHMMSDGAAEQLQQPQSVCSANDRDEITLTVNYVHMRTNAMFYSSVVRLIFVACLDTCKCCICVPVGFFYTS